MVAFVIGCLTSRFGGTAGTGSFAEPLPMEGMGVGQMGCTGPGTPGGANSRSEVVEVKVVTGPGRVNVNPERGFLN